MTLKYQPQAESVHKQLEAFNKHRPETLGTILNFKGVDGYDVYNTSVPFTFNGKTILAGRVESRENEVSKTMFFQEIDNEWHLMKDAPVLDLQDPFVTEIDGRTLVGGVYVVWDGPRLIEYSTQIYDISNFQSPKLIIQGPKMMKDIRLKQLPNGKIAVFSRPQGEPMLKKYGCIAKIGFAVADKLEDIDARFIENAPLLEGQFLPDEWGGVIQAHNLKNGLLGIIGHKSWGEQVKDVYVIHYYSIAFVLDPNTSKVSDIKIIATRNCYPAGPQKNARTADVTFTSGIIRLENGKARLFSGLNDCQEGTIVIDDPFVEFEKETVQ